MYDFYTAPTSLEEALSLKEQFGSAARVMAGGTDLLVELSRSQPGTKEEDRRGLLDLTRVPGLADIIVDGNQIHLGPLVTHNQCVVHPTLVVSAFPLVRACWEVGAPQIRNRATVAGNIITASPANDTIPPLLALDARVTLRSRARGERTIPLSQFMTGFRRVDLAADELLTRISIPLLDDTYQGAFIKLGLRRAQAISVVNVAVVIAREADRIVDARISVGSVAPVVGRASQAESYLLGRNLDDSTIVEAGRLALNSATPIDDIRASAEYRRAMVQTLVARALRQIQRGSERAGWSSRPVLLQGETSGKWPVHGSEEDGGVATVNGAPVKLHGNMTLLDSLRDAGFKGVKEGCAEGECGACTVFMDGMAVMACLVPAERAVGSSLVTVEGLGSHGEMHPVQRAMVESGGIQCGYCTPGFVMSGAKLLEERPTPTRSEAQEALAGNFCRCTGYVKILDAIVAAGAGTDK